MYDGEILLEYCVTENQQEVVKAYIKHGSITAAANALGVSRNQVKCAIKRIRTNAAKNGIDPEANLTHRTAVGFGTKRVSTLYNEAGQVKAQWHIQEPDKEEKLRMLLEAIEGMEFKPAPVIKPETAIVNSDLATLYTITDYHIGMYAWKPEAGDDWDISIAAKTFIESIIGMIDGSPNSELGILNLQGDFLHYDQLDAITSTSGHILDSDTRVSHMISVAMDCVMYVVELLLKKHKKVKLIICEGNHDLVSSIWIRKAMAAVFRENKRLEVDMSEIPYYAHLHGSIMIGMHHGHKLKNERLPMLFASEPRFREMWGSAKYTYIHTGHYHHSERVTSETGGAIVERHPTLAGRDAYAARGGYVSWRAAHAITYHKEKGEICRVTVTP